MLKLESDLGLMFLEVLPLSHYSRVSSSIRKTRQGEQFFSPALTLC